MGIEEEELLRSFENNEWKTVQNIEQEKDQAQKAAKRYLRKDVREKSMSEED